MTISRAERRARHMLPFARFMLGYFPVPLLRWLQGLGTGTLPTGVMRKWISADGVPCEWITPANSRHDRVLLYLHGGGFVYGWNRVHRRMTSYLADKMGIRALGVDYRLAPEYPFPAALDDCTAAYRWLLKQGCAPQNIVVAGASAGGNLALSMLLRLRDAGDPLPAAVACLSPVCDLSIRENADELFDVLLHRRALYYFQEVYVGKHDPHSPLLSPVNADLRGLPPLLIHAGENEFLCEDAIRLEKAARQAGVEVELQVYPRMWHVWQTHAALAQSTHSLDTIAHFLLARIERTNVQRGEMLSL
jgi:acetyl esterase/lipase